MGLVGWQRQDNGPSVQGAVEKAVYGFSGEGVIVEGAGRTDAGVHALAQVAHFDLARETDAKTVRDALNDHLRRGAEGPRQIVVLSVEEVPESFHSRFSAVRRRYVYRVVNRPAPLTLKYGRAWHVFSPLDEERMERAAGRLVGKHDFTTFRSVHCQAASPVKTLDALEVRRDGEYIEVEAVARSFLHNQVRAMTGTLVHVGEGKLTEDEVSAALNLRDRAAAGPTAPPYGLYLAEVIY